MEGESCPKCGRTMTYVPYQVELADEPGNPAYFTCVCGADYGVDEHGFMVNPDDEMTEALAADERKLHDLAVMEGVHDSDEEELEAAVVNLFSELKKAREGILVLQGLVTDELNKNTELMKENNKLRAKVNRWTEQFNSGEIMMRPKH